MPEKDKAVPILLRCSLLVLVLGACAGGARDERQSTLEALRELVVLTATAQALEEQSPEDIVATAEAAATEAAATLETSSTEIASTVEAASTEEAALAATATAVPANAPQEVPPEVATVPAPDISSQLLTYGIDPTVGSLVWVSPPILIEVEGFHQFGFETVEGSPTARDFVLSADIIWNSTDLNARCGFALRSDTLQVDSSQYLLSAIRDEQGNIMFQPMERGLLVADELHEFAAAAIDPAFDLQNDGTNRIAVVARGNTFSIFSNGALVGEAIPIVQFETGNAGFVAFNEAGRTVCQFHDAWLWQLG